MIHNRYFQHLIITRFFWIILNRLKTIKGSISTCAVGRNTKLSVFKRFYVIGLKNAWFNADKKISLCSLSEPSFSTAQVALFQNNYSKRWNKWYFHADLSASLRRTERMGLSQNAKWIGVYYRILLASSQKQSNEGQSDHLKRVLQ